MFSLLLFSLALNNILLVHPCPEYLQEYDGRCLDSCPKGLNQVEFTSVCTETCPRHAPYLYNTNTCVTYCPHDYIASKDVCVRRNELPNSSDKVHSETIHCPVGFCPSTKPYCYDLVCHEHCPDNTKSDHFNCVYTCSEESPYRYNSSCYKQCPPGTLTNKSCVMDCPQNMFLYGNKCVRTCPPGTFLHDQTCLPKCPESFPFSLVFGNTARCLSTCPVFSMRNDSSCEIHCPANAIFLFNRTCVSKCPESAPFVWIKTINAYGIRKPLCVVSCPDNFYLNGKTCVPKCNSGQFILRSVCVSSCPKFYEATNVPYKCVDQCDQNMFLYQNMCIRACPDGTFESDQSCVAQCPKEKPFKMTFQNRTKCVDRCPGFQRIYKNICQRDGCPKNTHMLNFFCYDKCPKAYNVLSDPWNYGLYGSSVCMRECPLPLFNDSGICVNTCSKHAFVFNRTCYAVCPSSHPYANHVTKSCVSFCPNDTVSAGYSCQLECPSSTPYDVNGICSESCPSGQPLYLTLNKTIPTHPYRQMVTYCVDDCRGEFSRFVKYYRFNNTCVKFCPPETVGLNGICVTNCSEPYNMTYIRQVEGAQTTECTQHCPNDTLQWQGSCFDMCPNNMSAFDGRCVNQCPKSQKYEITTNNTQMKKCISNCKEINKLGFDSECVERCPRVKPNIMNDVCVTHCPRDHPVTSSSSRGEQCMASCPDELIQIQTICGKTCQEGNVIVDGICVNQTKCPKRFGFIEDSSKGRTCRRECSDPVYKYMNGRECVKTCPSTTIFFDNMCVTVCPSAKPFNFNQNDKPPKCVKSCREVNLVGFNNTCITESTCSDDLDMIVYDRETCVKKCPIGFVTIKEYKRRCKPLSQDTWIGFSVVLAVFLGCALMIFLVLSDGFQSKIDQIKKEMTNVNVEEEFEDQTTTTPLCQDPHTNDQDTSTMCLIPPDQEIENVYDNEFTIDEETEQKVVMNTLMPGFVGEKQPKSTTTGCNPDQPLNYEVIPGDVEEHLPKTTNTGCNPRTQSSCFEFSIDDETALKTIKKRCESSSMEDLEQLHFLNPNTESLGSHFSDSGLKLENRTTGDIDQRDKLHQYVCKNTINSNGVEDLTSQFNILQTKITDESGDEAISLHTIM